jgi:hypothetical protein
MCHGQLPSLARSNMLTSAKPKLYKAAHRPTLHCPPQQPDASSSGQTGAACALHAAAAVARSTRAHFQHVMPPADCCAHQSQAYVPCPFPTHCQLRMTARAGQHRQLQSYCSTAFLQTALQCRMQYSYCRAGGMCESARSARANDCRHRWQVTCDLLNRQVNSTAVTDV